MILRKIVYYFVAVVVIVGAIMLFLRLLGGSEDTWLCQNGQWIKHGNPSAAMPTSGCGETVKTPDNAGLANPASVNCEDKGGRVDIRTDSTGGQYGICVFENGKECDEWALFRGECTGEITPTSTERRGAETSLIKPAADEPVLSPFTVEGSMPGGWYFEAVAGAKIFDANGKLLGSGPLMAKGEWMTTATVPFTGNIKFAFPETETGTLVLKNDNPSGLTANDKSESYPISFGTIVKVFFPNEKKTPGMPDCSKVFSVERVILKTPAVARIALEEMLKGPKETETAEGYITTINSGVKIQSLTIEKGVAKVDFDKRIEEAVGGSCRVSAIRAQIEETLKQFPTVKSVIISVDGRTEDILQP